MFFFFSFAFSVNFTRPKQITTSFIKLMVVAINITHFSTCLQRLNIFYLYFPNVSLDISYAQLLILFFSAIHVDSPPSIPTLTTSYVHGISSHSLLSSTVDQCLQRTVERYPDREALVFMQDGMRKTFAQFYQDVSDFAYGFSYRGLVREVNPVRLKILTSASI